MEKRPFFFGEIGIDTKPPTAFDHYLSEISKTPQLSKPEIQDIAISYAADRDPRKKEILVHSQLRLVISMARNLKSNNANSNVGIEDLIAEGNLGLLRAVEKFNPLNSRNTSLTTYAFYWIRAYMLNVAMREKSLITIGKNSTEKELFFKLARTQKQLLESDQIPTAENIAALIGGVTTDQVANLMSRMSGEASMDAPLSGESDHTINNIYADPGQQIEEAVGRKETAERVREIIAEIQASSKFSAVEKSILADRLYVDEGKVKSRLEDVAEKHGISKERVRQIESRLIPKLKRRFGKID